MVPKNMFGNNEGLLNLIDNKITIHFVHRALAYVLFVLIIIFTIQLSRIKGSSLFNRGKWWPLALVILQVLLGILTVLNATHIEARHWDAFEWLAQLHQLVAMCLLLSLIRTLFMFRNP
jgi:cytochrome c oxidase assembly protein subunit 15